MAKLYLKDMSVYYEDDDKNPVWVSVIETATSIDLGLVYAPTSELALKAVKEMEPGLSNAIVLRLSDLLLQVKNTLENTGFSKKASIIQ